MKSLVSLLVLVTICHGYLDFTVLQIDKRPVNQNGNVNPFILLGGAINALQRISPSAPNAQAWSTFDSFCNQTYGAAKAAQIHSLASTTVDTLLSIPEAFQSIMTGSMIDSWNGAINGYRFRPPCNATIAGATIIQLAQMNMQRIIYPGISNLFYNPFDTAMLSSLNESQIMRVNMNLFYGNLYSYSKKR